LLKAAAEQSERYKAECQQVEGCLFRYFCEISSIQIIKTQNMEKKKKKKRREADRVKGNSSGNSEKTNKFK